MRIISTKKAPAAVGPYSQAIEAGNTLYVSGQIPLDPETMEFVSEDVGEQASQCLKNLNAIIEEAGYSVENIVKCGVFLLDMNDFAAMNEAFTEYFGDHKPARFCIAAVGLPKGAKVEIDAIAVKG